MSRRKWTLSIKKFCRYNEEVAQEYRDHPICLSLQKKIRCSNVRIDRIQDPVDNDDEVTMISHMGLASDDTKVYNY